MLDVKGRWMAAVGSSPRYAAACDSMERLCRSGCEGVNWGISGIPVTRMDGMGSICT